MFSVLVSSVVSVLVTSEFSVVAPSVFSVLVSSEFSVIVSCVFTLLAYNMLSIYLVRAVADPVEDHMVPWIRLNLACRNWTPSNLP